MADVLKTGSDWLMAQLKAKVSTTVTIRRAGQSVRVSATVGRTIFDQADEFGGVLRWESRDFLIDVSDYKLNGVETEPKRGDRIEEVQDGVTHVYEVMGDLGGVAWRYSDTYRTKYRVHTKQVKVSS